MTDTESQLLPPQGAYQLRVDDDALYSPHEASARRWRWIGRAVTLVVLAFLALFPTLRGEMIRGDRVLLSSRPALDRMILDPTPPGLDGWETSGTRFTRAAATLSPARYLLRAEQWAFDFRSVRGFRFVGILMHAGCAVVLFAILQRLSLPWPWVTASLYTVTPLAAGAVVQIAHQPILLSAFLGLLATLVYLRLSNIDRRMVETDLRFKLPEGRRWLAVLTLVLWVAAVFAHPFAAVFPAVWAVLGGWRLSRIQSWGQVVVLTILVAAGTTYRLAIHIGFSGETILAAVTELVCRVGLLPATAWATIRLGLWPREASLVGVPMPASLLGGWALGVGIAIAASLLIASQIRRRLAAIASGIAFFTCFAIFAYAAVATAPSDTGEVGPFEGLLLLPLAAMLNASAWFCAALVEAFHRRFAASAKADDKGDIDLGGICWQRVGGRALAIISLAVVSIPAGSRATEFVAPDLIAGRDLARHPDSRRASEAAIVAEVAADNLSAAELIVANQIARRPSDETLRIREGQLFVLHVRYREAVESFRAAHRLAPQDSRPYYYVGNVHERRKELTQAESAYQTAIELATPALASRAQSALGGLFLGSGKIADARDHFKIAIQIDPDNIAGQLGNAQSSLALGEIGAADGTLGRLITLYRNDSETMSRIAVIVASAGDDTSAQRIFEHIVRIDPTSSSLNNLGTLLARKDRNQDAIGFFQRATEMDPSSTVARANFNLAMRSEDRSRGAMVRTPH